MTGPWGRSATVSFIMLLLDEWRKTWEIFYCGGDEIFTSEGVRSGCNAGCVEGSRGRMRGQTGYQCVLMIVVIRYL